MVRFALTLLFLWIYGLNLLGQSPGVGHLKNLFQEGNYISAYQFGIWHEKNVKYIDTVRYLSQQAWIRAKRIDPFPLKWTHQAMSCIDSQAACEYYYLLQIPDSAWFFVNQMTSEPFKNLLKGWLTLTKTRPQKTKVMGATLANAILPGAGYAMAGNLPLGIISFSSMAYMGGLTYMGYRFKGIRSVWTWVPAFLGLGWYISGIVMTKKEVHRQQKFTFFKTAFELWQAHLDKGFIEC